MTERHDKPGFRLDVEGLRGVAVFVVVAFHAGWPAFGGGFVGVDVFFVISGFLITGILQRQAAHGRVGLVDFWARRIRRLVPGLALVIVATLLAALVVYSPLAGPQLATEATASALYVSNVLFARDATSYFALPLGESPFLHTWSLGVEEQFYLVWPLLFFALAWTLRRRPSQRSIAIVLLALVAVGSFALSLWLTDRSQPWAFFSSPTRAWEFALGGLLALAWREGARVRGGRVLGWAGFAVLGVAVVRYDDFTLYPGLAALLPVAGTLALLAGGSSSPNASSAKLLGWAPLVWLGGLSYTWYLWHWPLIVLTAARWPRSGVAAHTVAAAVALGLAWATTRFVERPIRFRSRFTTSSGWTYAGGAALTAVALLAAVGVAQLSNARRDADPRLVALAEARSDKTGMTPASCDAMPAAARPPCASGAPDGSRTVLLLGDSHAAHWRPAIDQIAKPLDTKVVMHAFGGCPTLDLRVAREGTHQERPNCPAEQRAARMLIDELQPDLVVLSQSDYAGLVLGEDGELLPEDEQRTRWDAALEAFSADMAQRDIPLLVLLDTPTLDQDPIECLAEDADAACGPTAASLARLADRTRGEREAIEAAHHGAVWDPLPHVCPDDRCALQRGEMYVYADPEHLTRAFARSLTPQLREAVEPWLQS